MSSDSDESSIGEVPTNQHLSHIWKSIRQTKNISAMVDRHDNIRQRHHAELEKPKSRDYSSRQNKANLIHLAKQIKDLQQENSQLRYQLQEQRQLREEELQQTRKDYENKFHTELRKLKAAEKENIGLRKTEKVDQLVRQNQRLLLKVKALQLDNRNLEAERSRLAQLTTMQSQHAGENMTMGEDEGRAEKLLQLEQAQQTVARLVQLLRKTEQFREYGHLIQQIGNMHYLKSILKRLKANQLNLKPIEKKVCSCREIKLNEKLLWSPVQCYKILLEMKVKYDYLSQDCIEEVLFQFNRIYNAKEEKTVQKLKQSHEAEIAKLRKQLEHGYDQVLTKKQIHRLKKELQAAKSVQKVRAAPRLNQLRDQGQLEDLLKLKQKQIKLLKERIKLFETENGFQDKSLYYEGTLNALDRVLAELDTNEASLKEFEIRFRERVEDNMQPEEWLASYKQFFESLQELTGGLAERVLGLKEHILAKMSKGD